MGRRAPRARPTDRRARAPRAAAGARGAAEVRAGTRRSSERCGGRAAWASGRAVLSYDVAERQEPGRVLTPVRRRRRTPRDRPRSAELPCRLAHGIARPRSGRSMFRVGDGRRPTLVPDLRFEFSADRSARSRSLQAVGMSFVPDRVDVLEGELVHAAAGSAASEATEILGPIEQRLLRLVGCRAEYEVAGRGMKGASGLRHLPRYDRRSDNPSESRHRSAGQGRGQDARNAFRTPEGARPLGVPTATEV